MTYATGVQTNFNTVCPIEYLKINDNKTEITVTNAGTLFESTESFQACHWPFESILKKDYYIEGESEMTLTLQKADNAEIYIFKGSDRSIAESVVEQGDRLYPGNPLRVVHMEDLLIVFRKSVTGTSIVLNAGTTFTSLPGSFTLSYEVTGP